MIDTIAMCKNDYGGEGVKNGPKIDYVISERPLITLMSNKYTRVSITIVIIVRDVLKRVTFMKTCYEIKLNDFSPAAIAGLKS